LPDDPDLESDTWLQALKELPTIAVTDDDVLAWVAGPLRRFFPFSRFLGCYARDLGGHIHRSALISWGHDPELPSILEPTCRITARNCLAWWVSNQRPFVLHKGRGFDGQAEVIQCQSCPGMELKNCREYWSQHTVAVHGVGDPFASAGTFLRFTGVPEDRQKQRLAALELIAPVIHALMLKARWAERISIDLTSLTKRQCEVVNLVVAGLSDKAIAARLAISEHSVGNHLRAIFAKLGISRRGELVALLKQTSP